MGRQKKGDIETNYLVQSFDADMSLDEYNALGKNPLYIILDNLRSAFNVGSIFRLCDALRVKGLCLCGYTPYPPNIKLKKTSLRTSEFVPWIHFKTAVDAIEYVRSKSAFVWAAETTSVSIPYDSVTYSLPTSVVFGNESVGLSREIMGLCDGIIKLPMCGFKNSVNVAASVAVIGYKILEQIKNTAG